MVSADSKATVTCSCWKGKQAHEVTGSWRVKKAERLLRPRTRLVVGVSGRRWTWTIRKEPSAAAGEAAQLDTAANSGAAGGGRA